MKTVLVRAFVVALALTGAAASSHAKTAGHTEVSAMSAYPVPLCAPNDPKGCGID